MSHSSTFNYDDMLFAVCMTKYLHYKDNLKITSAMLSIMGQHECSLVNQTVFFFGNAPSFPPPPFSVRTRTRAFPEKYGD